jgi:hypothetical protein
MWGEVTMNSTGRSSRRRRVLAALTFLGLGVLAALLPAGSSATAQAPPQVSGQPRISGSTVEGSVLTASQGSFTGTGPFNYTYRWLRCPSTGGGGNGEGCVAISGATFRRYTLRHADVGHRLRVRVTAANSEGSASGVSNASAIVRSAAAAGPARNTAAPTISGSPQVGQTLTANNGTWTGAQPITYTYHWRRCDANGASCADISGATGKTYVLTSADQGATLRVRVTGRNARGSSSTTSAPTGVVGKAEAPSGSSVSINDVSLPNRLIVDRLSFSPRILRSRSPFTARFHVSDSRNHSVQGAMVFVVAMPFGSTTTPPESATGADGWVTFRMRATSRVSFGRPGSIPMMVRARKVGERLIGGVSTRRLVNLSVR